MPDKTPLFGKASDRKNKEEVEDLFREWAETYDEELEGYSYVAPQRGAAMLALHVKDHDAKVIDVGCGTGLVGSALADVGFTDVDGLDLSIKMLDQARAKGVYKELFLADLTGLTDVPDDVYEAAICVGAFTYGHVGPEGIDEVLRIVTPGGIASITVNGDTYVENGYRARFDQLAADGKCAILEEADAEYILDRDINSRIVVLKKA